MNGFTPQQVTDVTTLARSFARGGYEEREELLAYVDKLCDARVVAFAQGALLAGGAKSDRSEAEAHIVDHLHNTLAQYEALGLGGAAPATKRAYCIGCEP